MNKMLKTLLACLLAPFLLLQPPAVGAITHSMTQYELKAQIIERLPNFIKWPEESGMDDHAAPFVFGVIGQSPFGTVLEELYYQNKKKLKNKPVTLKYISNLDEIPGCHILFVCASQEENLEQIIAVTSGKPILTISDTPGFSQKGIIVNFYTNNRRVRFEINKSALRESTLTVRAQLLKIARITDYPGVNYEEPSAPPIHKK